MWGARKTNTNHRPSKETRCKPRGQKAIEYLQRTQNELETSQKKKTKRQKNRGELQQVVEINVPKGQLNIVRTKPNNQ